MSRQFCSRLLIRRQQRALQQYMHLETHLSHGCILCCVLSSRDTCDGLITRLEQCFSTAGPRPGINYTGLREVLQEFVILVFQEFFMNKYFTVEIF